MSDVLFNEDLTGQSHKIRGIGVKILWQIFVILLLVCGMPTTNASMIRDVQMEKHWGWKNFGARLR
ncbi:MAG: hypothetical protein PHF64_01735 [Methanoregula sp.]|jgi:hypothetical protein|nr:hypothetical protein [Methanoregula sp.]